MDHHQQWNDQIAGFGASYNTSGGIGPIKVIYGDGNDGLNASFKPTSLAELQAAFSDGALERMRDNIQDTISDIRGLFNTPSVGLAGADDFDSDFGSGLPWLAGVGAEEELQSKKLAAYNKQINEQLENHSILPSEMSSKDRELVLKIKQKVDEQYPHLDKANHDKKVAQSYFLVKKCQDHPEKAPSMQLAAAIVAIPAIDFVGWLIGVLVAYKAAEDAPKIARILLDSEASSEYNELNNKAVSSVATTSNANNEESGICKVTHPYSSDNSIFNTKEPWMGKGISNKYKVLLDGKPIYGLNPVKVDYTVGYIKVNTELPGGETAAKECFKNLVGVDISINLVEGKQEFRKPNGDIVTLRSPEKSSTGHWKVENNALNSTKVYEKITFKIL